MRHMLYLFAMIAALPASAQTARSPLEGTWAPQDRSAQVRFSPCGVRVCGILVSGTLRPIKSNKPGQTIISDLVAKGDGIWSGRFIADGSNLMARIKMTGTNTIDVKVCPISFMCKTLKMTKVQ